MKKVAIIGTGNIAKHLTDRLKERGVEVCFLYGRKESESFGALLSQHKPDAVFLTISTIDAGDSAYVYLISCLQRNIPVITCEKGALAYHSQKLLPYMGIIGFSATVGGGTQMLQYVKNRLPSMGPVEMYAVLNGTLNFVFDEMRHGGRSLGEACEEARRLGYAEPGASDPLSLLNGELKDVRMKMCVFFNTVLAEKRFITPVELDSAELKQADLDDLSRSGQDKRLIVSFHRNEAGKMHKPDAISHRVGEWRIALSFRRLSEEPFLSSWVPGGVGNAVHIVEGVLGSGGKYTLSGPGAGHDPTVSAMLKDFDKFC